MTNGMRDVPRRVIDEVINRGNLADSTSSWPRTTSTTRVPDRDTYRRLIVLSRVAFPDLMLTIEDEIVEGARSASTCAASNGWW
jgi:predicted ester cyclase